MKILSEILKGLGAIPILPFAKANSSIWRNRRYPNSNWATVNDITQNLSDGWFDVTRRAPPRALLKRDRDDKFQGMVFQKYDATDAKYQKPSTANHTKLKVGKRARKLKTS
jgi:hypothetical protein